MRRLVVVFALLAVVSCQPSTAPPPTEQRSVTDVVHGVEITDQYRWLEGDLSDPESYGAMTDELTAWTDAQNGYTRAVLDGIAGRAEVETRISELLQTGSVSAPEVRSDRYFYFKREGTEDQSSVYMREGTNGEPQRLLDPAVLDPSGLLTISWIEPSHDGTLLAYGTYAAGDENSTLHLYDVDAGSTRELEIPKKVRGVQWLADGSGFVYRNLEDAQNPYSGRVRLHRLGTPVAEDTVIFRQFTREEDPKLATTYGPFATVSHDGRWLILGYLTGTRSTDLWVVDLTRYLRTGRLERREIIRGESSSNMGTVVGDTFFMRTNLDAPNGRVVAVDLKNPSRGGWLTIVPERTDAVIEEVRATDGGLAVLYLENASNAVEVIELDGTSRGRLTLPGIGSADIDTVPGSTEGFLTFMSFNCPTTVFRVDLATPAAPPEPWEAPDVPVDPSSVVVKQEWYTSEDGTEVSLFVVHASDLQPDGNAPTILYGYGGFTVTVTPRFRASMFQWFEAGGVYAAANLRGGGEYGEQWHIDGMLGNKQNVFDDYIAAAEHLIEAGYTRTERLAAYGGSNGGLLTGAALVQRPDLFGAVISAVPLLDMLRYQDFLMARYWIPEYGSAEDPDQFAWLFEYSPYHHVEEGTAYPAVMLTAGENDARVHPMHARKMAAALQHATASDPDDRPILLHVERDAGHGQGKPLNLRVRDAADIRLFLMWQLGML